ncbi:MAG: patatin-like phospholipase family protein [Deltaproteobacteria bacterium]|nr:patatin-like phospholipase family protein [Deltaproteobacteria bacterium]MBW2530108.1 patatin-like phospholipase family protein [Deltaproteobacteria bacterium]
MTRWWRRPREGEQRAWPARIVQNLDIRWEPWNASGVDEHGHPQDEPARRPPRTALVLAGGGALGAYEAGVLQYVLDDLQVDVPDVAAPRFDLFCGTSVGALNASYLASAAHDPARSGRDLAAFWRSVTFDRVFRFSTRELGTAVRLVLGTPPGRDWLRKLRLARGASRPASGPHEPVAGLLDTSPLDELMGELVPWEQLQRNVDEGTVDGVAICTTEICTGTSIIFFQTGSDIEYRLGRDPAKHARRVRLGREHAMASAAIPFLFPSVQIRGVCYTDGALRQNTPLNPALRMGADRVLVVSIAQEPEVASRIARIGCRRNAYPGALFLLGKTVGILLTQSLDYELKRVEMYNKLLSGGAEIYGAGFAHDLNTIMGAHRNATYRPVRTCHIRPSEDLNQLALQALRRAPQEVAVPGLPGKVLSRFFRSSAFAESELLATLMFTPTFVQSLVDLGYRDARSQREELVRFFAP